MRNQTLTYIEELIEVFMPHIEQAENPQRFGSSPRIDTPTAMVLKTKISKIRADIEAERAKLEKKESGK